LQRTAPLFDLASVRDRLPSRRVDWFERVASTMIEARTPLIRGRVVVADEQTAGVGRHGRNWYSAPGEGLYISMVLAAGATPVIMLALGLAARESITETTGLSPDLRWPNDVLINDRKCAGILAQLEGGAIIAGIGINVSQRGFPDGFETPPTSLLLEGGSVSREDLLVSLVEAVDRFAAVPSQEIVERFTQSSSYASGRRVRAESEGRTIEGFTCGLDASGFLVVREDTGKENTILAGGVRPA
jgi:BirA family transcriptional regulator, biotin operon repressor / biotin---[acetyl-CoA-carboxylase] ligase